MEEIRNARQKDTTLFRHICINSVIGNCTVRNCRYLHMCDDVRYNSHDYDHRTIINDNKYLLGDNKFLVVTNKRKDDNITDLKKIIVSRGKDLDHMQHHIEELKKDMLSKDETISYMKKDISYMKKDMTKLQQSIRNSANNNNRLMRKNMKITRENNNLVNRKHITVTKSEYAPSMRKRQRYS